MKQKRLSDREKIDLCSLYETGDYNFTDLSELFKVSVTAIKGLLNRRGYVAKSQSELQRKYDINESYFDVIDTQEKAYFLGFLYADGCNFPEKNTVKLSLKEGDKEILEKLSLLLQPTKPLCFGKKQNANSSNQYILTIYNKHISERLSELGCVKAKTHLIEFPLWLPESLYSHFIRGYFDGDGYISSISTKFISSNVSLSIVGTISFCLSVSAITSDMLDINWYIETRHKERNNNIRQIRTSGRTQIVRFLDWIYKDASLFLERKKALYLEHKRISEIVTEIRLCTIDNCNKKHFANGYCRNHYYALCGGVEKRHARYMVLGS